MLHIVATISDNLHYKISMLYKCIHMYIPSQIYCKNNMILNVLFMVYYLQKHCLVIMIRLSCLNETISTIFAMLFLFFNSAYSETL